MQPISNHISIQPDPIANKSKSGMIMIMDEVPFVASGIVKAVSVDIKNCPVSPGDWIAYLKNQEKWQEGECILNLNHVQAVL